MNWTVIVPLKPAPARKTRLGDVLDERERARLGVRWFFHVTEVLARRRDLHVLALTDRPPPGWQGGWLEDRGTGLNAELQQAWERLGLPPIAVLHADLPRLDSADVDALLKAGERSGCAIAPDRHGTGTNGLAIGDGRPFRFAFGIGSFALHREQAGNLVEIVDRPGLALDVDTPEDLHLASGSS